MKIAIVEDDINMRKSLEFAFSEKPEFEVVSFKNAKDALKKLDDSVDLIITDITMPGMDGLEFIRALDNKYDAIVMTGDATLNKAVETVRLGAKDFLIKPFEIDVLFESIKRCKQLSKLPKQKPVKTDVSDFSVVSDALKRPLEIATKVAITDASCLLLGESGVGKEVFAKYIHKNSSRQNKPFIAINMAALPETLIEAELFGYEKGAFTGADTLKAGKFEEANGGTLFLDEIGEMPYNVQAKILRALQEKEIVRLGSSKHIKIDVRIISATNINIENSIENGEFREDLYYRLNTVPIQIPPLRDRKEEILPLAQSVLDRAFKQYNLSPKPLSKEAQDELLGYSWHGNVRELISVCERAAILSENAQISKEDLFLRPRQMTKSISDMEKNLLLELLNQTNSNIDEISKILAIDIKELNKKLKKYKLIGD